MNRVNLSVKLTVILTFLVFLTACSSANLIYSWKDSDYRAKLHKTYVVGETIVNISRYQFEDYVGKELESHGVNAILSYRDGEFPVTLDDQVINERTVANQADSLLIGKILSKYGEQTGNETAIVEITVYDAATGKPIWSSQYQLFSNKQVDQIIDDLAKSIVGDMQKSGLL